VFGELVKARREKLGLSLREFCRRLGEDPSNWSKVERGILRPPLRREKLRQIAMALDIVGGSAEWEALLDAAAIGAGEIPGYVRENREVYGALPALFRAIGGASLTAEEIERMIEKMMKSAPGIPEHEDSDRQAGKRAIIVAGPNGAGKTTFVREYLEAHEVPYISADAIAEKMTEGDIQEVALPAGKRFFDELRDVIGSGESFVVETTLSGRGFQRVVGRLRDEGYAVVIIYIYLDDPGFCVTRIRERTQRGGHHVPQEDVIRRFHRSIVNFWQTYRLNADSWHLVCNTAQEFIEVANGCGDKQVVFEDNSYRTFLDLEGSGDEQ
jgi:predicted ABC-type ATPase